MLKLRIALIAFKTPQAVDREQYDVAQTIKLEIDALKIKMAKTVITASSAYANSASVLNHLFTNNYSHQHACAITISHATHYTQSRASSTATATITTTTITTMQHLLINRQYSRHHHHYIATAIATSTHLSPHHHHTLTR